MGAPVPTPARGTLWCLLRRLITKCISTCACGLCGVMAGGTDAADAVFWSMGYVSSEQTPVPRLLPETAVLGCSPTPNSASACGIWYLVCSNYLPWMRPTQEKQSQEARNRKKCSWFCFVIPQARGEGPGKSGVGGSLGNQGAWGGGTVYA